MNRMCFHCLRENISRSKVKINNVIAKPKGIIHHYVTKKVKFKVMPLMNTKRIPLRVL